MARHLDDYGVGEYKSNWWLTLIYALVILAVFLLPFSNEYLSPVNYLIKHSHEGLYGVGSILFIILFGVSLINVYLCNSNFKIARSVYCKIARVLELLVAISCLVVYALAILNSGDIIELKLIKCFFIWLSIDLVVIVLTLINYFKTKKISIYD